MHPLVTADALAAELADDPPVLLDVRWRLTGPPAHDDYLTAHLPGAVFVDLDADLAGPPGPAGRHPIPEPRRLQESLRRWGVGADTPVVAYDDGGFGAARAWWLLGWAGCEQVRVLDGGYAAWLAAGLPVTDAVPHPATGDVVVCPGGRPVLDADSAARLVHDGVLLDARSGARYLGEVEPVDAVAGHIPGAVSAPATAVLDSSGRWRPVGELRAYFADLGVTGSRPVGAYCGSGVTAAGHVLALALTGVEAALYPGSWSQWITDDRRPVATGRPGGD